MLPNPAKNYPRGKSEEELKGIPPAAIGWRVSLTCEQLPKAGGELVRVTVYHSRDNGQTYVPIRSVTWDAKEYLDKNGQPLTELWIGGEYPFVNDGKDASKKDKFRYLKATDLKVEIDSKIDFTSTVTLEAVELQDVGRLNINRNDLLNGQR